MLELTDLGRRIMVCGPSNSGKSTLAVAIGRRLGLPVVHLDRLNHLPNTNWQPRPEHEFRELHDAAIAGDGWIIDGNYSGLMPQRVARATGIILLGDNRVANLTRYVRRTLFEPNRAGNVEGTGNSLNWDMVHWILVASPKAVARYRATLPQAGLPFVECRSMNELKRLYRTWSIER